MPHFHLWHGPSLYLFVTVVEFLWLFPRHVWVSQQTTCYCSSSKCDILQISGIHSTLLFGLITNYLHQPWHPIIRRFLATMARAVFSLTMCGCPVCSKDFVSSQGLACHLTSVPYCCQSWLSVSNGLPIDNINLHSFWPTWHPRNRWSYHHHSPSIIVPNYSYLHCWWCWRPWQTLW